MPFNQNFNPNFPMPVGMNRPQFPPFPHPMQPMMMQQTAPNPPLSHSQFPRPPVNPAPPQPSTTSIENEKMTTVFVGAIPAGVHDEWVERVLKTCGILKIWKRVRNADGSPKSFGFATYVDPDSLLRALRILGGENRSSGPIQLPALDGTTSLTKIMMKVDENTRKLLDKYRPNKTLSKPEIEADRLAENHLTEVIKAMKSLVPAMVNLRSQNIISNKELQDAGKSDDKDDNGESANDSASRGASETSSLIETSTDPDAALPGGKKESVIASQIAHFKDRINRQKRQEEERLQRIRAAILEHQPPTRPDDQQPVPSILSKLVPRQVHPSKASDSHGQRSEDKRDDVDERHHERSSKDRHHERERKKRREKRKEKDDEQIGKEDGELVESAHKRRRRSRSRSRSRSRRDRRHRHRRRSESTEKRQRRRRSKSRSKSPEETAETSDGVVTQLQNTDSPSEEISMATEGLSADSLR
ncbi:hypothetical protein BKA69DRAFT_1086737 [Paraphysoderma sedebokerense]|nr:hypothetical protein BKA69DRAFT_1086737 [Paraphysoderma sedebokerense]